jgi:DNA (cytosine-5)-methyltransferase 1
MKIRFGSVCSGIEAASVAWHPLGWEAAWLSEIEKFPCEVLKHHYPNTPNLGDMTLLADKIRLGEIEAPDVFCGGTPCQAFSVAGLRQSLDDSRGNLSLTFCEIANAIDDRRLIQQSNPAIIFWENVPGVLNTKDNAFGCFLAGLAGESDALIPPGGRWTDAGFIDGPKRAVAWRTLDAQYFGLAQRRKRVFVVASARNDICPAEILFEFEGVRRDTSPSREKGERTSKYAERGIASICPALGTELAKQVNNQMIGNAEAFFIPTTVYDHHPQDSCINEVDISPTLNCRLGNLPIALAENIIGRDAKNGGNGFGVTEGGPMYTLTAAGVPGIAHAFKVRGGCEGGGKGYLGSDETAFTLSTTQDQQIAIGFDAYNTAITGDISKTLDTGQDYSHVPNVIHSLPIGVDTYNLTENTNTTQTLRGFGHIDHVGGVIAPTLTASNDPSRSPQSSEVTNQVAAVYASSMAVRRLTPVECERLQGFPDNYSNIKKNCPDGPRYKALGNSMAVPVMKWIGERIQMVEDL